MESEESRLRRTVMFDTRSLVTDKYGVNGIGSVVWDPEQYKGRLPKEAVQEMMHDAMCWVLPAVQPAVEPEAGKETYRVSLRRVTTGRDYPLPGPVRRLNRCMEKYVGTPPFDEMKPEGADYNELVRAPEKFASGIYEERRDICKEPFKLRVVRLPTLLVEGCDTAVVYAVSPELPTTWAAYNARPGGDNTPVLQNIGASWILQQCGWTKVAVGGDGEDEDGVPFSADADDKDEKLRLQLMDLRFAHNLMRGRGGMNRHLLQGSFVVSEPEARAGDVVVPMTLRQLRFLRHGLTGGVNYHVKSFGNRSYMACIRCVAGWDVYVQVNMHASLQHVRQWFGSDAAMVGSYIQAPYVRTPACDPEVRLLACDRAVQVITESLDAAMVSLKKIDPRTPEQWEQALKDRLTGYKLQRYLRFMGGRLLLGYAIADGESIQRSGALADGNKAVQQLLAAVRAQKHGGGPADFGAQMVVMRSLYKACLGAAREVWRMATEEAKGSKPQVPLRFQQLLMNSERIVRRRMSLERARAVLVLQTCTNVAPEMWWERAISVMNGSRGDTIADLCNAVLQNGKAWKGLYPEPIFGPCGDSAAWRSKVDEMAGMDRELSVGKRALEIVKRDYVTRDMTWMEAAAYCLLVMDFASVTKFKVARRGADVAAAGPPEPVAGEEDEEDDEDDEDDIDNTDDDDDLFDEAPVKTASRPPPAFSSLLDKPSRP